MSKLLYDLFIFAYPLLIKIVSPFNPKAKKWITGRVNIFEKLRKSIDSKSPVVWMHCASLGEFEQGRPVLERLKAENKNHKFLLTFFSPSGYEVRKNYKEADFVFYLPMDSKTNATKFFDIVDPKIMLFIKYEFWYYYLMEAKKRNVPLLLVSGIFRRNQPFFNSYGNLHKKMLGAFHHFFVQNKESAALLASINFATNVTVTGDTRFDRVIEIAENFQPIALIETFIGNSKVIVAGSTWSEDDEELDHFANTNTSIKFIIAPHNIEKERTDECLRLYKNSILYSQLLNGENADRKNTLVIDNIGMLSQLYKYASICYVGGAFGDDGVHNVLEAAVYAKPVVFGPEYEKYFEANELVETGGALSIENALELEKELNQLLTNESIYSEVAAASKQYVYSKQGATENVIKYIYENRLLTN